MDGSFTTPTSGASIEEYKALKSKIDADGSGDIDKDEMKAALSQTAKDAGRELTDEMVSTEVESIFREFDVDENGKVDEAEFVAMMAKAQAGSTTEVAVEELAAAAAGSVDVVEAQQVGSTTKVAVDELAVAAAAAAAPEAAAVAPVAAPGAPAAAVVAAAVMAAAAPAPAVAAAAVAAAAPAAVAAVASTEVLAAPEAAVASPTAADASAALRPAANTKWWARDLPDGPVRREDVLFGCHAQTPYACAPQPHTHMLTPTQPEHLSHACRDPLPLTLTLHLGGS